MPDRNTHQEYRVKWHDSDPIRLCSLLDAEPRPRVSLPWLIVCGYPLSFGCGALVVWLAVQ